MNMTRLTALKTLLEQTPPLPGSGMVVIFAKPDPAKVKMTGGGK